MIVDKEAFARLECNRCGQCCTRIALNDDNNDGIGGPLELLILYGKSEVLHWKYGGFSPVSFMEFAAQLEPTWDEEWDRWVYRCGYFSMEDNCGQCAIYDQRPEMCQNFPNGGTVTYYNECAWNVKVVDYEVLM